MCNRPFFLEVEHLTSRQNRYRTGSQSLVREINLSAIMNRLRESAPISRSALAEITGLNKTTVSSLVQELIEHQFVREIGFESTGTGRPAMLLELNPAAGCIISGEIGADSISVICTNFATEVICRYKDSTQQDAGQQAIIDHALTLLRQAIDKGLDLCGPLLGLVVGVPGLVNRESGTLLFAPNLNWRNVPLGAILQEAFDLPVFVDNEANMAALGEYYFGAAQDYNEVLYVSAGVGLGGGIVRGGQLFNGATGIGGEFGHMTMDPAGELCSCGSRGCWETQVSQPALFRYIRRTIINNGRSSVLSEMTGDDLDRLTVPTVVDAAHAGDPVALEALEQMGHYLGIGTASLVNALNPDLVVLGGILSLAGEFLLPLVKDELRQHALLWSESATQVVLARHGLDACVMGGVAMVYQAILAQPGTVTRQSVSPESFLVNY
jgi:glucokinase-like ROK family protein